MADAQDITTLLNRWNDGDQDALDELTPIVYDGLRRLAESAFRSDLLRKTIREDLLDACGGSCAGHAGIIVDKFVDDKFVDTAIARDVAEGGPRERLGL